MRTFVVSLDCQLVFVEQTRGCSSMVERQLPKLRTRVRFPSPAPNNAAHQHLVLVLVLVLKYIRQPARSQAVSVAIAQLAQANPPRLINMLRLIGAFSSSPDSATLLRGLIIAKKLPTNIALPIAKISIGRRSAPKNTKSTSSRHIGKSRIIT